jgi:hypothetical protein
MANTRYLTTVVETWVRSQLGERFGQPFQKQRLRLSTGREMEFDAVSADATVVAAIKTSSGLTSGGNFPSGKVNSCIADLWYLNLVDAPERLLVLTNPTFYEIFIGRMDGAIPNGIEVLSLQLPVEIQSEVDQVVASASSEMGSAAVRAAIAVAAEDEAEATI